MKTLRMILLASCCVWGAACGDDDEETGSDTDAAITQDATGSQVPTAAECEAGCEKLDDICPEAHGTVSTCVTRCQDPEWEFTSDSIECVLDGNDCDDVEACST